MYEILPGADNASENQVIIILCFASNWLKKYEKQLFPS